MEYQRQTIRSRLDRWYIQTQPRQTAFSTIIACPYSDHQAVQLIINVQETRKKGPGVWKLNTEIIKDKKYEKEIRFFLKYWRTQRNQFETTGVWWEEGKKKIKNITIKHCVRRTKQRRKKEIELINELSEVKRQKHPNTDEISRLESEIKKLDAEKINGIKTRSRATWTEFGEKPTKYFFALEKSKQPKHTITELETQTGRVKSNVDILEETRRFYQELYAESITDKNEQRWLLDQLEQKLDAGQQKLCEGPVTKEEMDKAIKTMQLNKAPGTDGLPVEFYSFFWKELQPMLLEVYNGNYENEEMMESQRQAILRLLYKKDEKYLLLNWRPISLLNIDYKILAKVMANRLKKVLPFLIEEDQTCGVEHRTIFENLFRLRDLTHDAKSNNSNLILINIDQKKAFDKVNRQFLTKIMTKMNFGPSFKQ